MPLLRGVGAIQEADLRKSPMDDRAVFRVSLPCQAQPGSVPPTGLFRSSPTKRYNAHVHDPRPAQTEPLPPEACPLPSAVNAAKKLRNGKDRPEEARLMAKEGQIAERASPDLAPEFTIDITSCHNSPASFAANAKPEASRNDAACSRSCHARCNSSPNGPTGMTDSQTGICDQEWSSSNAFRGVKKTRSRSQISSPSLSFASILMAATILPAYVAIFSARVRNSPFNLPER